MPFKQNNVRRLLRNVSVYFHNLSVDFYLYFSTEQLAPNKETILKIESNEFVPQSFTSSADSKDQQVSDSFSVSFFSIYSVYCF